jgi:hypothetical protein
MTYKEDELVMRRSRTGGRVSVALEDGIVLREAQPCRLAMAAIREDTGLILHPLVEFGLDGRWGQPGLDRVVRLDLELVRQQGVICHVLADGREVRKRPDPKIHQVGRVANPAEHEQLRGVERARGENHLLASSGFEAGCCKPGQSLAPKLPRCILTRGAGSKFDTEHNRRAARGASLKKAGDLCTSVDVEVRAREEVLDVCAVGAAPGAGGNSGLRPADADRIACVLVLLVRKLRGQFLRRGDHGPVE